MDMNIQQAYENIEKIIIQGFLTVGISFNKNYFLIKNITDKEYNNMDFYRSENDKYYNILYHLSFCTVFINSINFLEKRIENISKLVKFYTSMPISFIVKIRDIIEKLNNEYLASLNYLEGFCYTDRSRYLWSVVDINSRSQYLGIAGLNNVGMNSVQENWIIINKKLDDEDSYQKSLDLSFLIASASNPKGVKVLSRNYDSHKKELDELRSDIAKYGYDRKRIEEQQVKAEWTAPIKSREDLVRELYRQMSGKKDKHDLFIDQWMKQQRDMAEEAKKQAETRQREFRVKLQDVDMTRLEESMPISSAELKKRLIKNKISEKSNQSMSSFENYDQKDRFIKKISSTIITPGK